MKCKNCGFDGEGKFCSMCGAPMPTEVIPSEQLRNPYSNTSDVNFINKQADNTIPIGQNQGKFQTVPPQQNSFSGIPPKPQNGFANNFPQPQGGFAPVQPNPVQPPVQPKKSGNAGKIVLISVLGAIILAGIVIMIISAVVNSLDLPPKEIEIEKTVEYKLGEKAETSFGSITLADVERGHFSTDLSYKSVYDYSDNNEYMFSFDIENTTDEDFSVSFDDFNVAVKSSGNDYTFTNIDVDGYPVSITLKPHSTDTFTIFRCDDGWYSDRALNITYSYKHRGNSNGEVVFVKSSPMVYGDLYGETETDFGNFKITDVNKPSQKEILDTYFKNDSNGDEIGENTTNNFTDGYTIYEFTADITDSSANDKPVSLNGISGSFTVDASDGLSAELLFPLAVSSDDYSYTFNNSSDLNLQIPSSKTVTVKFIIAIRNDCDNFNLSFQFDNDTTVSIDSTLTEIEDYI